MTNPMTLRQFCDEMQISIRKGRMLIYNHEIEFFRVGSAIRITEQAKQDYIARNTQTVQEQEKCHTDAKIVPIGGRRTQAQTRKEFAALLSQPIKQKQ